MQGDERFLASLRMPTLAAEVSKQGTSAVESKLDQLVELSMASGFDPGLDLFLEEATYELWQQSRSLEPVMYLYEKYSEVESPEGGYVSDGFITIMARIVADCPEDDKHRVLRATFGFLNRHLPSQEKRLLFALLFAEDLDDQHETVIAKSIVKSLIRRAPDQIKQNPEMRSLAHRILSK